MKTLLGLALCFAVMALVMLLATGRLIYDDTTRCFTYETKTRCL